MDIDVSPWRDNIAIIIVKEYVLSDRIFSHIKEDFDDFRDGFEINVRRMRESE
jgi:hypothetical protein